MSSHRRILVAEDEASLRHVISRVLKQGKHEVVEAGSGEEAWDLFRQNPCPLVITDIVLGQMSGLQLVEKIKAVAEDTVAIVMSSHGSTESVTRALRAGAYDFLAKPFDDVRDIATVVDRALDRIALVEHNRDLMKQLTIQAERLIGWNDNLTSKSRTLDEDGLLNHRGFRETAAAELARARHHERPASLVLIDVHEIVNEGRVGDAPDNDPINALGPLIRGNIREWDLAARNDVRRFELLLPGVGNLEAWSHAEALCTVLEAPPFETPEAPSVPGLRLSVGVATFPNDGETLDELLVCAGKSLEASREAATPAGGTD